MYTIITRSSPPCIHCVRAKQLMKRKGVEFEEVDYADEPLKAEGLMAEHGWRSFPMVLDSEGALVGGADQLFKQLNK